MQLEASEGRKRIIAHLDAQARRDSSQDTNQTSYSTSQIDEAVMDAEVRTIYETAQQATRSLYDLATDYNMPDRPNWIIRVSSRHHVLVNWYTDCPVDVMARL